MQIALVVARSVLGPSVLVFLGEPLVFAVLLSFVMLLTVFDEAALAFERRPFALALDDLLRRLLGWSFA